MRKTRAAGFALALLVCGLLSPGEARASLLGLDAGTYDVTLTCVFVNCGGPFTGTLTTDGSDVSDWLFNTAFDTLPLSFTGDPAEFDSGPPSDIQEVFGPSTPGGYSLILFGGFFEGDWNIESSGVSIWRGTWEAVPHQDEVAEPASLLLLGTGIAGVAATARRRRR